MTPNGYHSRSRTLDAVLARLCAYVCLEINEVAYLMLDLGWDCIRLASRNAHRDLFVGIADMPSLCLKVLKLRIRTVAPGSAW